MTEIAFFHQVRADGGERTGIDVDGQSVLQYFQPERSDFDPALLWYIDIVCEGENLPEEPDSIREWFLTHAAYFTGLLESICQRDLHAGFDSELRPFQREFSGGPEGAGVRVVVSAVRRLVARQVAERLQEVAINWKEILSRLTPLPVA
jgi:hypothetical protein